MICRNIAVRLVLLCHNRTFRPADRLKLSTGETEREKNQVIFLIAKKNIFSISKCLGRFELWTAKMRIEQRLFFLYNFLFILFFLSFHCTRTMQFVLSTWCKCEINWDRISKWVDSAHMKWVITPFLWKKMCIGTRICKRNDENML